MAVNGFNVQTGNLNFPSQTGNINNQFYNFNRLLISSKSYRFFFSLTFRFLVTV